MQGSEGGFALTASLAPRRGHGVPDYIMVTFVALVGDYYCTRSLIPVPCAVAGCQKDMGLGIRGDCHKPEFITRDYSVANWYRRVLHSQGDFFAAARHSGSSSNEHAYYCHGYYCGRRVSVTVSYPIRKLCIGRTFSIIC